MKHLKVINFAEMFPVYISLELQVDSIGYYIYWLFVAADGVAGGGAGCIV